MHSFQLVITYLLACDPMVDNAFDTNCNADIWQRDIKLDEYEQSKVSYQSGKTRVPVGFVVTRSDNSL